MNRILLNRICAFGCFLLAVAMFVCTSGYPERAAAAARYVNFLASVLVLLNVILLFQSFSRKAISGHISWVKAPRFFITTVVGVVIYVWSLQYLGFFLSSGLFMVALGWKLGFRRKLTLLVGSAGLLLFVYIVFVKFLNVPVPSGIWGA